LATGKFVVQGINDPQDAERVNEVLKEVFGIQDVKVRQQTGEVQLNYDERSSSFRDFKRAVMDAGYTVFDDGEVSGIEKERIDR
jgi:copper chaperone CopZ